MPSIRRVRRERRALRRRALPVEADGLVRRDRLGQNGRHGLHPLIGVWRHHCDFPVRKTNGTANPRQHMPFFSKIAHQTHAQKKDGAAGETKSYTPTKIWTGPRLN